VQSRRILDRGGFFIDSSSGRVLRSEWRDELDIVDSGQTDRCSADTGPVLGTAKVTNGK